MSDKFEFDYYYGVEAEQFSFYRVPRQLIQDDRFKNLSNDAKLLYGLLLDRMGLSMKNGWLDDYNRAYIIYTIDNIMEDLNCGKQKAVKTLSELDDDKGIGLIEKRRRGFGQSAIIYVKNFSKLIDENDNKIYEEIEKNSTSNADEYCEVRKSNHEKYENQTAISMKIKPREVRKSNHNKYENQTTRSSKIRPR